MIANKTNTFPHTWITSISNMRTKHLKICSSSCSCIGPSSGDGSIVTNGSSTGTPPTSPMIPIPPPMTPPSSARPPGGRLTGGGGGSSVGGEGGTVGGGSINTSSGGRWMLLTGGLDEGRLAFWCWSLRWLASCILDMEVRPSLKMLRSNFRGMTISVSVRIWEWKEVSFRI